MLLKPVVLAAVYYSLRPVVRRCQRMKDGKIKRLLLRKMYDLY